MAKITLSPWIADIRGKVGAAVFQQGRGGLILRNQPAKINKNSNRDSLCRSITANLQGEWISITQAQKELWDSTVLFQGLKLKRSKTLLITGQNAFLKFNYYRNRYGIATLLEPQFSKCTINPVDITINTDGNDLTITADRVLNSSVEFIIILLTFTYKQSVNNPGSAFKMMVFDTTNTDTFNLNSPYTDTFGRIPQPGDTIFMKYTNADKLSGLPFPFKTVKVTF